MNELENILGIQFPKRVKISHATNNSKKVKKNSIFFGLQGAKDHGSKYIKEALYNGASIVVHDDKAYKSDLENIFYIDDLEEIDFYKFLNCLYYPNYMHPEVLLEEDSIYFFGITGTNGKTTTSLFCQQIFENHKDNNCSGETLYIGTMGVKHNTKEINLDFSNNTTPDIFTIFEILKHYRFFTKSMQHVSKFIYLEVSSHALEQNRLKNLPFERSAILNIGNDHLDYHKNNKAYRKAKFKIINNTPIIRRNSNYLFNRSSFTLLNIDCSAILKEYKKILLAETLLDVKHTFYTISKKNSNADFFYEILESDISRTTFKLHSKHNILDFTCQSYIDDPKKPFPSPYFKKSTIYKYTVPLFPEFNVLNFIFARILTGFIANQEIKDDGAPIKPIQLPSGRFEVLKNIPSNVIIDYAHSPDSFQEFLPSLQGYFNKVIVIFGCGGDRDKNKRSKMLKIAIENSSQVIFTSDNNRSESFKSIYSDASKGNNIESVIDIEDRQKAIIYGSKLISHNDCLVILGKGHERTQELNGKFIKFSDHEVVNEIYK